jgi:hypothetical protein
MITSSVDPITPNASNLVLLTVLYSGLFHLPYVFLFSSGMFIGALLWRKWVGLNTQKLPPAKLRLVASLLVIGPLLWYLPQMDSLRISSSFLLALTAIKLLETHAKRDWTALLFISLGMLFIGALRSQDPSSAGYLAGGLFLFAAGLFKLQSGLRPWRTSTVLFLQALPLTLLLFVFFPRSADPMWEFVTEVAPQQILSQEGSLDRETRSVLEQSLENFKRWWARRIKGFDLSDQQSLYEQFGITPSKTSLAQLFAGGVAALLGALVLILWLRSRTRDSSLDEPGRIYKQLTQTLRRTLGITRQPQESPIKFLQNLKESKPELEHLVTNVEACYIAARYNPNPQPRHLRELRQSAQKLRWCLWTKFWYRPRFARQEETSTETSCS